MEYKDGKYVLSTGTALFASYGGVIGLGSNGEMYVGYDGSLSEDANLSSAEQVELALYMAKRWWFLAERLADGVL